MKILEREELKEAKKYLDKAVKVSGKSICQVSRIGTVVVKNGAVIGEGFSGPMGNEQCNPCVLELLEDKTKTEICYSMHSGERAVVDALVKGEKTEGANIYTIKAIDNKLVPYNIGYCVSCSRLFLDLGVKKIIFPTDEGIVSYEAEEFYNQSFDNFVKQRFIA